MEETLERRKLDFLQPQEKEDYRVCISFCGRVIHEFLANFRSYDFLGTEGFLGVERTCGMLAEREFSSSLLRVGCESASRYNYTYAVLLGFI